MAEKISAPLVHMVETLWIMGLKMPMAKGGGNSSRNIIRLRAHSVDEKIVVEIGDDGKGLDASKLIARAWRRKSSAGSFVKRCGCVSLIFAPGFSTAAAVTSISGRGVGMDVVRREIESLGGEIVIETALGVGSTFKLVMPLIAQEA